MEYDAIGIAHYVGKLLGSMTHWLSFNLRHLVYDLYLVLLSFKIRPIWPGMVMTTMRIF